MSYPRTLEYHLLSRFPLVDSSPSVCLFQGRFSCAPRYRDYSQRFVQRCADYFIHRCLSVTVLFIEFSRPLCLSIFPSKVSVYFARIFHDVRRCFNLKTGVFYHESREVSTGRSVAEGLDPIIIGKSSRAIEPAWFARPATEVAPDLIGCTLVRKTDNGQIYRGLIVETEAYEPGDPACHGYRKKSDRNAAMFGPPGTIYVYLIYGMYHCVNLSTDAEGVASAILIRALQLDTVPPWIDRTKAGKVARIAAGPGKLCRVLDIDLSMTGASLVLDGALWCEPRHPQFQEDLDAGKRAIVQTSRIGITKGVDLPWRWYLADCPAVSRR